MKGDVTNCGKAHHLNGILTALTAKYGLTARQASLKLNSLKKDPRNVLSTCQQDSRVADLAHGDPHPEYQTYLVVKIFYNTLENP